MTGSSESVLSPDPDAVLLISTNWVGDCIMSLPAVQVYRSVYPNRSFHVLCRPGLTSLWEMSGLADKIHPFLHKNMGLCKLFGQFTETYAAAYILPNSIRSALAAKISGAVKRVGLPGHHRKWLLTDAVELPKAAKTQHQCWESFFILGLEVPPAFSPLPQPCLNLHREGLPASAQIMEEVPSGWVGFIPCAARGSSKEWPEKRFLELGQILLSKPGTRIALFGGREDAAKCQRIAEALSGPVLNLAGKTDFKEWAACLSICRAVVANDSGGMHLAAALGIPVAAIYGLTDPSKTGPLGARTHIIKESAIADRNIPRSSEFAQKCLNKISAARVADVLTPYLDSHVTGEFE